ncbi:head GIN domain-containing protein [Inhella gelatinilytica]|uniref:DUF2807 domain-containing protein n=1 Tax=Inhella gelatinilytica TaxID=2795030 RepID=A0A931NCE9_9BURK|nr:head GIN domain-containing protein [Inhella gelatinilytica]MBH9551494.1 DUF2807 domain-containing protein [Inhella gelatinilytica]
MKSFRAPLVLFASLSLLPLAQAAEKEWSINVKQETNGFSVHVGGTTSVGHSAHRIKGSGKAVEVARALSPFSRVKVSGPVDVVLVQGNSEGAQVRADDNIESMITTQVEGDTLVVGVKPGASFSTRQELRVTVQFKQLQALHLSASGDAKLDRYKGERLELDLSGSGDLQIGQLDVRELTARLRGSGDVQVAGTAERQDWHLSGSGDVAAASLSGQKIKARLSGSGDLDVGVCQELEATLSGSGDLSYAGRPQVKSQISGSGEISAR